jgi:exosortase/archaeosortase family protein
MALVLVWVRSRQSDASVPIHDRQVDYIVGVALLLGAIAVAALMPISLENRFWAYRIDLLTLPLFVAGIVALFYGLRTVWSLRVPIAFLLLAWPVPYLPLIGDGMRASVDVTVGVLALAAGWLPFASPIQNGADGLFRVHYAGGDFALAVGSACSGVNSLVGFVLIGSALATVTQGSLRRRVAWLLVGLALIWFLNVLRIEAIFVVGSLWGRGAALEILHPVAGLVVFNLGLVGMLSIAHRFGLTFKLASSPRHELPPQPVRRIRGAMVVGMIAALSLGVVNASYARYEGVSGPAGQPLLQPFSLTDPQVSGWQVDHIKTFTHGEPYFGVGSTWDRMRYDTGPAAALTSDEPVFVDVIHTPDLNGLLGYGLEACYTFHNFRIESQGGAALGGGVEGELLSYYNPRFESTWTVLGWEWPYEADDGSTAYERVVLLIPQPTSAEIEGAIATDFDSSNQAFRRAEGLLVTMGREIVRTRIQQSAEQ